MVKIDGIGVWFVDRGLNLHSSRGWGALLMGASVHGILFDLSFLSVLSVSGCIHRSGALRRPRRLRAPL